MSKQPAILDLDEIIPTKRIVKLKGKQIDVSVIPSSVTLDIAQNSDKLQSGSKETFPMLLEQIINICKPSFPEITSDWLVANTDLNQLLAMIEFVLAPVKERAEGDSGKNVESPSQ